MDLVGKDIKAANTNVSKDLKENKFEKWYSWVNRNEMLTEKQKLWKGIFKILDLKSVTTEMKKKLLDGFNNRFEMAEEIIGEFEERFLEIFYSNNRKERCWKNT